MFVGNIPYDVSEDKLKTIFSEVGTVVSFRLVTDRETGKPKGYGFCEYLDGFTAMSAMRNLNAYDINGRNLRVDFADGGGHTAGSSGTGDKSGSLSLNGREAIAAIDNALESHGPVKLYDTLVAFQKFARESPQHAKIIFAAHPSLAHALLQAFDLFDISTSTFSTENGSASTSTATHHKLSAGPVGGGSILGLAPPVAAPPVMSITGSGGGLLATPPPFHHPAISSKSRDPRRRSSVSPPPPYRNERTQAPRVSSSMPPPPLPTNSSMIRPTDPRGARGARDPRSTPAPAPADPVSDSLQGVSESDMASIEVMARAMTKEKMMLLPAEERQVLMSFMTQMGIQIL